MIQALLDLFAAPADTRPNLTAEDERLALATLLIRVAKADDHYHAQEVTAISAVLGDHFGLQSAELDTILTEAEELEAKAPDTVRFTRIIKDAVPYEERAWVMEALWRVALADGSRDYEEDSQLRLMTNLLGVNDRDSGLARQRMIAALKN
ncbi:MAG: TerB family tellurite resistance protein [Pseudomonadota bacterium]